MIIKISFFYFFLIKFYTTFEIRRKPLTSDSMSSRMQKVFNPKGMEIIDIIDEGGGVGERGRQWTEELSSEPRASIYHNFLSKEECEHLINIAKPHLKRSGVRDAITGKSYISSSRTSNGAIFRRGADKVIGDIEKRIADYTKIPIENGEGMQVLHYAVGQKFDPHFDYDPSSELYKMNGGGGGPRMATLLMYLSDVEEGGETAFPNAKRLSCVCCDDGTSGVGRRGIFVKPKMGDALLFWSMRPDGTRDFLSLHGKPVIKGDKWSCTKWMHVSEYKLPGVV